MSQSSSAQLRPQTVTNHMLALASAQQSLLVVRVAPLAVAKRRFACCARRALRSSLCCLQSIPNTSTPTNRPQNIEEDIEKSLEAGVAFGGLQHPDKVASLRAGLVQLLATQHEVKQYSAALGSLVGSYAPTVGEQTDFGAELDAITSRGGR
jgi:hypothetical protein